MFSQHVFVLSWETCFLYIFWENFLIFLHRDFHFCISFLVANSPMCLDLSECTILLLPQDSATARIWPAQSHVFHSEATAVSQAHQLHQYSVSQIFISNIVICQVYLVTAKIWSLCNWFSPKWCHLFCRSNGLWQFLVTKITLLTGKKNHRLQNCSFLVLAQIMLFLN